MKTWSSIVCVLALSLVTGACGSAENVEPVDSTAGNVNAPAVPTGTGGTQDAGTADAAGTQGESAAGELPDTASPLALIGGLGLLSIGGAAALRLGRSRSRRWRGRAE
jgi:hypothetical protein